MAAGWEGCGAVMAPAPWVEQKQSAHGSRRVLYKQDFACLAPPVVGRAEGGNAIPKYFLEPAPRIQIEKVPLRLS